MIAYAETISVTLPGPANVATQGPVAIIVNVYYTALMLAGLLALGVLVYAGLMRIFQAGSASGMGESKKWFAAAGTGLILLLGAYVLLAVINPGLNVLQFPQLSRLTAPVLPTAGQSGYGCTFTAPSGQPQTACSAKNDCSDLKNAEGQPLCGSAPCQRMTSCTPTTPPGGGGGRCQAPAGGPCSVASLQANGGSCFGSNITMAAGVCNVESNNNQLARSGTDKCADGSSVSFGLFQINISANQIGGLNCPSAFDGAFSGSHPTCNITNRTLYNQCVAAAININNNVAKACSLSGGGSSWRPWGPATRQACGI